MGILKTTKKSIAVILAFLMIVSVVAMMPPSASALEPYSGTINVMPIPDSITDPVFEPISFAPQEPVERHPDLTSREALRVDYEAGDLQFLTIGECGRVHYDEKPIVFPPTSYYAELMKPEYKAVLDKGFNGMYDPMTGMIATSAFMPASGLVHDMWLGGLRANRIARCRLGIEVSTIFNVYIGGLGLWTQGLCANINLAPAINTATDIVAILRVTNSFVGDLRVNIRVVFGSRFNNIAINVYRDFKINHLALTTASVPPLSGIPFNGNEISGGNGLDNIISVRSGSALGLTIDSFRLDNGLIGGIIDSVTTGNHLQIRVSEIINNRFDIYVVPGIFDNDTVLIEATLTVTILIGTDYFRGVFQIHATRKPIPIVSYTLEFEFLHANPAPNLIQDDFRLHVGETLNFNNLVATGGHFIESVILITTNSNHISVNYNGIGGNITSFSVTAVLSPLSVETVEFTSLHVYILGQQWPVTLSINSIRIFPNHAFNVTVGQEETMILAGQYFDIEINAQASQFSYFSFSINFAAHQRITGIQIRHGNTPVSSNVQFTPQPATGTGTFVMTAAVPTTQSTLIVRVFTGNNSPSHSFDGNLSIVLRYRLNNSSPSDVFRLETHHSFFSVGTGFAAPMASFALMEESRVATETSLTIVIMPKIFDTIGRNITPFVAVSDIQYTIIHTHGIVNNILTHYRSGIGFMFVLTPTGFDAEPDDFFIVVVATATFGGVTLTTYIASQGVY